VNISQLKLRSEIFDNNNNNNNNKLRGKAPKTVKTFNNDIHMEFGLEKYAKISCKRGKLIHSQNLVIDINREIP